MENGFGSIQEVKNKILQEETINGIGKPDKQKVQNDTKDSETAHAAFEGKCSYCKRKGHKAVDCFARKRKAEHDTNQPASKYWCDICYKEGHSTDYCSKNSHNKGKGKGSKGKAKGGKGKGRGKGGKGKPAKGGRGKSNFPANYVSEEWSMYNGTKENQSSTEENWNLKEEESSSSDWYDYQLSVFETETSQEHEFDFSFVLMETDVTAWTQNNAWTEQDFKFCTQGD
jgi:hypothetical protein